MDIVRFSFIIILLSFLKLVNAQLVITEIMYNPPESGTDSLEYIEIYNAGPASINLNNYTLSNGITHTFTNIMLDAEAYLTIAKDSVAIATVFGAIAYQWNSGTLANAGEAIVLKDGLDTLLDSVTYSNVSSWPTGSDGEGPSIVLCDINSDNNIGSNWLSSTSATGVIINTFEVFGSPGTSDLLTKLTETACDSFLFDGNTLTRSGSYKATFAASNSCDSTVQLVLIINNSQTVQLTESICSGDSVFVGGNFQNTSGVYVDSFSTITNCDSIVRLTLTVEENPIVTLTLNEDSTCENEGLITLSGGNPAGGTYAGPGIVSGIFNPELAGVGNHLITYSYTNSKNCSNEATNEIIVTNCISSNVNSLRQSDIYVYPNPINDELYFNFNNNGTVTLEIFDITGKLVLEKLNIKSSIKINTTLFEKGIYTWRVGTSSGIKVGMITKY